MKKIILKIPPLLLLMVWPALAHLQTINTTAGSVTACPGQVLVPIEVTNFNNIGGVSLVIAYNIALLTFEGYQDLHAAMAGGEIAVNSSGGSIYITWAKSAGASIGSGVMLKLKFQGTPGTASLAWNTQTPGNCEYSNISGNIVPATFVNGSVAIQQPPVISAQPENKTVLVNQSTSFSVSAICTNPTYKWYVSINNGSSWTLINNGGVYSGATTATLSLSTIPLAYNAYLYRCEINGTCSPAATSNYALLTVIKPLITSFETSNVCPGNILLPVLTSNFTDVAGLSLVFTYNPQVLTFNGYQNLNAAILSANFVCNASAGKIFISWASGTAVNFTTDTTLVKLKFTASTGSTNLTWNTEINGACEYVRPGGDKIVSVFQNASFTVFQVPVVNTHPVNKLIPELTNTSFSVSAQASGISWQWQLSTNGGVSFANLTNGGFYSGVFTATLAVNGATLAMNGYMYRCVVGGTCGPSANSAPATLTVLPKITASAATVSGCPSTTLVVPVNVLRFVDVGSFSLGLSYNPSVLTFTGYQSLHANIGPANFVINASNGKVLMTWYSTSPATVGDGVLLALKFSGATGSSGLTWDTQTAGVCEFNTITGQVIFNEFLNGNVTVNQPPIINTQPVNKTIYAGGSTSFSVGATGTGIGYQWQVSTNGGESYTNLTNSSPYSGVNSANLTISPAATAQNTYMFRCLVTGSCTPFIYSDAATLNVTQAAVYTTLGSVSNSCTGNVSLPVNVTNCNGISGISLVLIFDDTKMQFAGYHSLHSQLNQGMLVVNSHTNKVIFSWASTTPVSISSGTLVQFHFRANAGVSSALTWNTQISGNCEYSDSSGSPVTAFFTNGNISTIANALVVNAGEDVEIQVGNSVQLNGDYSGGVAPYTINWSPAEGLINANILNPVANPAVTTTYRLTVSGSNSCQGWDEVTVFVDNSLPENLSLQNINVVGSQCYNASQTIILAGEGTYFTVQAGANLELLAGQNIIMLPGTHFMSNSQVLAKIVTNNIFCSSRMIVEDTADTEVLLERLPAEGLNRWITVYPNPTNGLINVRFREGNNYNMELAVFNLMGEEIVKMHPATLSVHPLDLHDFPSGVYVLKIVSNERAEFIKVIKQ